MIFFQSVLCNDLGVQVRVSIKHTVIYGIRVGLEAMSWFRNVFSGALFLHVMQFSDFISGIKNLLDRIFTF